MYHVYDTIEGRWGPERTEFLGQFNSLEEAAVVARRWHNESRETVMVFYKSGMEYMSCSWS